MVVNRRTQGPSHGIRLPGLLAPPLQESAEDTRVSLSSSAIPSTVAFMHWLEGGAYILERKT